MKTKIIFTVLIVWFMMVTVYAEDFTAAEIARAIDDFDPSLAESFSNKAVSFLMPENIFSFAMGLMGKNVSGLSGFTGTLLGTIVLASIAEVFKENLGGCGKITDYICILSTVSVCFIMVSSVIEGVSGYLKSYTSFMTAMSGASSALLASSGNVGASLTSAASSSFIVGITEALSVQIILPCVKIIISLSAVNALSSSVDLSGITSFIKSFCLWGIGILFTLFGAVHGTAVAVSSGTDSLALRGIRFSAARLIPVAGGMISESMRTVIAGVSAIKTTAGGLGIAYILYSLIPALTSVLCVKLPILAGIFTARLFGARQQLSFLEGLNGALNILMSVCIFASVSGIVIFAVFMNTAVSI